MVKPTARQLQYQDWEYGMFLHFGLRTFYEGYRDMDERKMSPERFNPTALDCDNWCQVARDAGMKYIVLTAKHHCGFANWPSRTTDFSVASSPWQNGRGDVIAEFTAACRAHGLGVGLYYSPYDAASPVYDDPKAYDDYFINQVSELLVPYGPIDILWFDGCGSEGHEYDWARIIGEIRRMQPNIMLFNMGDPDFRWVGNEDGIAPWPTWNVVSEVPFSIRREEADAVTGGRRWLPAECDVRIRERNWFYSDSDGHTLKTMAELVGLYYYSVGRGCNLLLNFGPDRRGLIPDADAARIREVAGELKRRFGRPLARLEDCRRREDRWIYQADSPILLDHVVLQEELTDGERIRRFAIKIIPGHYRTPITVYEGHNVGHKAICAFAPVRAREVWVEILEAEAPPKLRGLELHLTA